MSAVWRKSLIDSLSRVLALTGVSMPIFWLGVMLAWVFAVELHWLPTGARLDSPADYEPWTHFVLIDAVLQRQLGDDLRTRSGTWCCPRWPSPPSRSRSSRG